VATKLNKGFLRFGVAVSRLPLKTLTPFKRASNTRGLERIQKAPVPRGREREEVRRQVVVAKSILPDRPSERPTAARRAHRKKGART